MFVYRQELPVIAKNSLHNCHVFGMDSVVFDNTPGRRVRAYIAQKYHELWRNGLPGEKLTLAIHPHHCDIEIENIFGQPTQVIPVRHPNGTLYHPWIYRSEITQGDGGFTRTSGPAERYVLNRFPVEPRKPWFMGAKERHSFYVQRGAEAAWMVREFKEDLTYDTTCWSDRDLTQFTTKGLYEPMSVEYLKGVLDQMKVNVI